MERYEGRRGRVEKMIRVTQCGNEDLEGEMNDSKRKGIMVRRPYIRRTWKDEPKLMKNG